MGTTIGGAKMPIISDLNVGNIKEPEVGPAPPDPQKPQADPQVKARQADALKRSLKGPK